MNNSMKAPWILVVALALGQTAVAGDWSNWRGPNYNGSSDATNLPTDFSKTKNVKWKTAIGGMSASTPIVVGDRIFMSRADYDTQTLHALCLSRATGKILWSEQVGQGYAVDSRSNFASPSPVSDGKIVVFFYGNGELVCFSVDGKRQWQRNLQKDYGDFAMQWTFSASPTLHEGTLYQPVLNRNVPVRGVGGDGSGGPIPSYLLAMDPATGKTKWRHVRPSDAVAESLEAFTTIIPHKVDGKTQLIVVGGDCLTGHDPATGEEIWRWGTWNNSRIGHWRLVPSPVVGAGVMLACGPKKQPVYAVRLGGKGKLPMSYNIWKSKHNDVTTDVATPLFYKGKFYILKGESAYAISRVDPQTGDIEFMTELREERRLFRASPTGADGKIFLMNHAGTVMILDADSGELINTIPMGDEGDDLTRASIVAVDSELFIRTNSTLYCISKS
ncbi:MAG: outer membrane protein assembly factor BamB family protein [Planctomycetota bacterium]|jgi:outer membrane protein assembly factor BamB